MTDLHTLQFYATPEHDCSYLDDLKAQTLFVDPHARISQHTYSQLSELGFRRSGQHIYRPHCHGCKACVSVRIPIPLFTLSRSQKRVFNKNKDLTATLVEPSFTQEYYTLYSRYINERHHDGDMFPPNLDQFTSFLVDGLKQTYFVEFRDPEESLVAVSVIDMVDDGMSAIYTFYDPSLNHRSLGTFCILWQAEYCRRHRYENLYLGYWVRDCRKMNYKISFRPYELLIDEQWVLVTPS